MVLFVLFVSSVVIGFFAQQNEGFNDLNRLLHDGGFIFITWRIIMGLTPVFLIAASCILIVMQARINKFPWAALCVVFVCVIYYIPMVSYTTVVNCDYWYTSQFIEKPENVCQNKQFRVSAFRYVMKENSGIDYIVD